MHNCYKTSTTDIQTRIFCLGGRRDDHSAKTTKAMLGSKRITECEDSHQLVELSLHVSVWEE